MQHTSSTFGPLPKPLRTPLSPWALRAWPPLLWQAAHAEGLQLQHLRTRVTLNGERHGGIAGQTLWGGSSADGEAGVAWDWMQISQGVVALSDPLSVISNLRLLGDEGEVLTSWQAARYLNQMVHALPWQDEVARALRASH